jgi:hypothetical protein
MSIKIRIKNRMIKQNSDILNKLFLNELQNIIQRYNTIDEDTKNKIEVIITNLKDEELKTYLMNNPDKLTEIIKEKEIDTNLVIFFTWFNLNIKEISIEGIKM